MAITTVVSSPFFNKLIPALRSLEAIPEIGSLTLAMLVPSAIDDDFRSLVLSSEGLDALSLLSAIKLVNDKLRKNLGRDADKIDTISILRTRDSAVKVIGESYDIPQIGTVYQASGMALMALGLEDAFLFLARPRTALAA